MYRFKKHTRRGGRISSGFGSGILTGSWDAWRETVRLTSFLRGGTPDSDSGGGADDSSGIGFGMTFGREDS